MIPKTHYATQEEYHQIHTRLRQKLQKDAFDAYYKCQRCGCHDRLEIHIPNPDPRLENQPGFYTILCHHCHRNTHSS